MIPGIQLVQPIAGQRDNNKVLKKKKDVLRLVEENTTQATLITYQLDIPSTQNNYGD